MGLYDRPYYRTERPRQPIPLPSSMVGTLVLVNVIVYLVDAVFLTRPWLSFFMAISPETLTHPALWWQFLTYGFAHSPTSLGHILFNMLTLWFLGPDVESLYGRWEFLRIYLGAMVAGGITWTAASWWRDESMTSCYGASAAIAGVVVLFAFNFPRRQLALFFILPVPAWVAGALMVGLDALGAAGKVGQSNVAYTAHLGGAIFALLYYQFGWNFGRLLPRRWSWPRLRGPRLRLHRPPTPHDLNREVDRILEKISREGESSLTRQERRTLEEASRRYQQRRTEDSTKH